MYFKISGISNPKQKKQSGDAVTRKFKKKAMNKGESFSNHLELQSHFQVD